MIVLLVIGPFSFVSHSTLPDAASNGARLFVEVNVDKVTIEDGRATGVQATSNGHSLTVSARAVVSACGTIETPPLLLRSGLALGTVVPIALAADTVSIAVMEIVDNLIMLTIPGAMDAGLDSLLFWGSLAFALLVAGAIALPVNRWLIARGRGHAVVHEHHAH